MPKHARQKRIIKPAIESMIILSASGLVFCSISTAKVINIITAVLIILLGGIAFGFIVDKNKNNTVGIPIIGIGLGFSLFAMMRYLKLSAWPLQNANNWHDEGYLLSCHLVLAACVISSLIFVTSLFQFLNVAPGSRSLLIIPWRPNLASRKSFVGLTIAVLSAAWALVHVATTPLSAEGPWLGLLIFAAVKAAITGFGEEYLYRGVIQKAAITRYGALGGLIFQAAFYTLFHVPLGAAVVRNHYVFLAAVAALGLLFGLLTVYTKTIFWAGLAHTAIDIVVEWNNLC